MEPTKKLIFTLPTELQNPRPPTPKKSKGKPSSPKTHEMKTATSAENILFSQHVQPPSRPLLRPTAKTTGSPPPSHLFTAITKSPSEDKNSNLQTSLTSIEEEIEPLEISQKPLIPSPAKLSSSPSTTSAFTHVLTKSSKSPSAEKVPNLNLESLKEQERRDLQVQEFYQVYEQITGSPPSSPPTSSPSSSQTLVTASSISGSMIFKMEDTSPTPKGSLIDRISPNQYFDGSRRTVSPPSTPPGSSPSTRSSPLQFSDGSRLSPSNTSQGGNYQYGSPPRGSPMGLSYFGSSSNLSSMSQQTSPIGNVSPTFQSNSPESPKGQQPPIEVVKRRSFKLPSLSLSPRSDKSALHHQSSSSSLHQSSSPALFHTSSSPSFDLSGLREYPISPRKPKEKDIDKTPYVISIASPYPELKEPCTPLTTESIKKYGSQGKRISSLRAILGEMETGNAICGDLSIVRHGDESKPEDLINFEISKEEEERIQKFELTEQHLTACEMTMRRQLANSKISRYLAKPLLRDIVEMSIPGCISSFLIRKGILNLSLEAKVVPTDLKTELQDLIHLFAKPIIDKILECSKIESIAKQIAKNLDNQYRQLKPSEIEKERVKKFVCQVFDQLALSEVLNPSFTDELANVIVAYDMSVQLFNNFCQDQVKQVVNIRKSNGIAEALEKNIQNRIKAESPDALFNNLYLKIFENLRRVTSQPEIARMIFEEVSDHFSFTKIIAQTEESLISKIHENLPKPVHWKQSEPEKGRIKLNSKEAKDLAKSIEINGKQKVIIPEDAEKIIKHINERICIPREAINSLEQHIKNTLQVQLQWSQDEEIKKTGLPLTDLKKFATIMNKEKRDVALNEALDAKKPALLKHIKIQERGIASIRKILVALKEKDYCLGSYEELTETARKIITHKDTSLWSIFHALDFGTFHPAMENIKTRFSALHASPFNLIKTPDARISMELRVNNSPYFIFSRKVNYILKHNTESIAFLKFDWTMCCERHMDAYNLAKGQCELLEFKWNPDIKIGSKIKKHVHEIMAKAGVRLP